MKIVYCVLLGYLMGAFSPSALVSAWKKKDIRKYGTKNLGTINTVMNFGKGWGVFVMVIDITKALAAVKLAKLLFPQLLYADLIAGLSAVLGHIYPFYLNFKGGKGLAPFAGVVMAYDPLSFLILFIVCVSLMFAVNYSFALPISATALFPVFQGLRTCDPIVFLLTLTVSAFVFAKHFSNIGKAMRGEDIKVRDFLKKHFSKS